MEKENKRTTSHTTGLETTGPEDSPDTPRYREVQRFRQPVLWVLLLGISAVSLCTAAGIAVEHIAPGQAGISDPFFTAAGILFGAGLPLFFWFLALEVEVIDKCVRYRFFPVHASYRSVAFDAIAGYRVGSCRLAREYSGFGIRYRWKGYACTVRGDRGIIFTLKDGSTVIIGSASPEDFARAIARTSGILPAG
ncbi:hypothetical protein J2741_000123 [Methanolinea mesophila]|uniref:hypothetical protein n=1 Tax=Methanolinea mesophila TaxID=547055 RepID=UPI001AE77CB7|nr:hypothetical protein [Methanolinea mesophila]MBP1927576.1 hypothetical protein [Methanolinea mesophila]